MGTLRDVIADSEHRDLLEWWFSARGDRSMPSRSDFDPIEHPRFLPRIFLVEVSDSPPQFLNRLCGTEIDSQQGYAMTGRPFEDVFQGALLTFTEQRFVDVAFNGRISYYTTTFVRDSKRTRFTRLLLPLSDDGERVSMILGSRVQSGALNRDFRTLVHDPDTRQRNEAATVAATAADRDEVMVLAV